MHNSLSATEDAAIREPLYSSWLGKLIIVVCIQYCVVKRRFIPSPCIASNLENSVISRDSGISAFVFGGLGIEPIACDFIVGGSCIGSPASINF